MATKIRMTRKGTTNRPFYRIVVADSRSPRDGRFIEILGTYDPLLAKDNKDRVKLDTDRISYWLGVGAQPSERVEKFIKVAGIELPGSKPKKQKTKEEVEKKAVSGKKVSKK